MVLFPLDWPDQLIVSSNLSLIQKASILVRCQNYNDAETLLLALLPTCSHHLQECLLLLAKIALSKNKFEEYAEIINKLQFDPLYTDDVKYLEVLYLYKTKQIKCLKPFDDDWWQPSHSIIGCFVLFRIKLMIVLGEYKSAWYLFGNLPEVARESVEGLLVEAFYLIRMMEFGKAFELVRIGSQRFPGHEELQSLTCELSILSRSQQQAIPVHNNAYMQFPRNQNVLKGVITIQFLQNLNADVRKSSILQRLYAFTFSSVFKNDPTIFAAYERNGNCDWVNYAKYDILDNEDSTIMLMENLALQLSSCESPRVAAHLANLNLSRRNKLKSLDINFLKATDFPKYNQFNAKLRIAWCSSDIAMHPVFRFIYSFFAKSDILNCDHYIVDTNYHAAESTSHMFDNLSNVQYINLGSTDNASKISAIRELSADIAVDLSGWTGGHFQDGFMARIAKHQFNYLGYFASVGIPQMDYWIGDHNLFPKNVTEYHSEQILRLSRCFIAWQPADDLIESSIDVVDMSQPFDQIRFGSFNANRKLSDATLSTWGRILDAISGSRLVLKASNADDPRTQQVLKSRMIQNGLDPERILWINRTKKSGAHLYQYSHIDIALDPFPNGGCTTTCEALWMGVPTITLTGSSYVSRMSTAVLNGADLSVWCATSIDQYIQLAILNAENVSFLRQHRDHWRNQIVTNQLGDAQSLMSSLEESFMLVASN